jgi:hypothetical protein
MRRILPVEAGPEQYPASPPQPCNNNLRQTRETAALHWSPLHAGRHQRAQDNGCTIDRKWLLPSQTEVDRLKIIACSGTRRLVAALGLALATVAVVHRAAAQATSPAYKTNSISVFAGGTYSNPQYGPYYDKGVTFGANFIQHLRHGWEPSIEGRININNGTDAGEKTYLVGIRAQKAVLTHLHPYGDGLIGGGNVRFNLANGQNYTTADLDVDVFRQYQLKLDMQQQYWLLGDQPFKPWIATVGVTYRFHFRDYIH